MTDNLKSYIQDTDFIINQLKFSDCFLHNFNVVPFTGICSEWL